MVFSEYIDVSLSIILIFERILSENKMESIYCPEDDTYRIYCGICDKLCIDRYYQNHLKSQTHLNNLRKNNSTFK